jgi:serine/threonine protein kinase
MPLKEAKEVATILTSFDRYKIQLKKDANIAVPQPRPFYIVQNWDFTAQKRKGPLVLLNPSSAVVKAVKEKAPGKKITLMGRYRAAKVDGVPQITPLTPKHAPFLKRVLTKTEATLGKWVPLAQDQVETDDVPESDDIDEQETGEDEGKAQAFAPEVKGVAPQMARKLEFEEKKFAGKSPPLDPRMARKLEAEQKAFEVRQQPKAPVTLPDGPAPVAQNTLPMRPPPPRAAPVGPRPSPNQPPPKAQPPPQRQPQAPAASLFGKRPPPPVVPPSATAPKPEPSPTPPPPQSAPKPKGLPKLDRDLKGVKIDKVNNRLGSGSFGDVYEIPPDKDGPKLAFKTFKATDKKAQDEMQREVDAYTKIGDHPNVAKCFGIQEVGGETGLVMEKIEGGKVQDAYKRLDELRQAGQISHLEYWGTIQHIIGGTLKGLAALEDAGLTHNDIKEDNVMLDLETMEPKLVDFGLAQDQGGAAKSGALPYSAPEKLAGKQDKASTEQDSFSVGQMLHKKGEGKLFSYGKNLQISPYVVIPGAKDFTTPDDKGELPKRALTPAQPGSPEAKQPGRFAKAGDKGYEAAYAEFLNLLMHPDPKKRLTPKQALEHPFLRESIMEGGIDKQGVLEKLKPTTPAPQVTPAKGTQTDLDQQLLALDPQWKEFQQYAARPELRGAVNTAAIERLRQTAENFSTQPGKLAAAEKALDELTQALPRALAAFRLAAERAAPIDPKPPAKRSALAAKAAPIAKVGQDLDAHVGSLAKSITAKDVKAIADATHSSDSRLQNVVDAMEALRKELPKVEKGELVLDDIYGLIVALKTSATHYVKEHKSPKTKEGKARLAGAQQMLGIADDLERKVSRVSDEVFAQAEVIAKTKDADLSAAAVNALEGLLKQKLITQSTRDHVVQVVAAARKRLAALHADRLAKAENDAGRANVLLDIGGAKPPAAKGQSDSFFINGEDGRPKFLLKPVNGESRFSDAWPDGGGAAREVLLSRVNDSFKDNLGLDFGVPKTTVAVLEDPAFASGTLSKETKRTGALQTAVALRPGDPPDAKSLFAKAQDGPTTKKQVLSINEDDAQAIAVLDFITLNGDRHAENLLVQSPGDNPGQTRLVPIDAGQAFPTREAFRRGAQSMNSRRGWDDAHPEIDEGDNLIMQLPVAQKHFDGKALAAIDQLDPDETARRMKAERDALAKECPEMAGKITDESIEISRRSQKLLKAAARELTIRELGSLYAAGFLDIIDAPDPDQAIADAIRMMKAYSALGGDDGLLAKRIQPSSPPLSLAERLALAQKLAAGGDPQKEHFGALKARLAKLGPGFIADSSAEEKRKFNDLVSQPLPEPITHEVANIINDFAAWETMGGDAHLKVLLAGNDAACRAELARSVRHRAGRAHNDYVNFFKLGGYPRLKKELGPKEYQKIEGLPFADHLKKLEELAAAV